ncbi:uncharacterized protein CC84DRAFT_1172488 [Paraphaeosphaeria sporulosa]|uniref:Uncharacterized protein n=1 Tax=Paraphaeosphaeria sporulosa TaxID=1460663 RepID=A0A177CTD3_9PLEO|nr:uncharacterized protein CC84DRAFT_1172488 [Paraphaeosphaeria sporulosa]OAG10009.1 hypothetical protein CC84DRAFT_1172488 [Paraphaeosphaeria sporulosa]
MESDTYTDPLASLFRPADKPRFASLNWPVWDGAIFDPNMRANRDSDKLAFIAGTVYVRHAVSLRRPKIMLKLLDQATLNHLARWGINGFVIGEERASERIERDRDLLASFRSGVLLAMDELRKAEVPNNVNQDDLKEVIDALESYVHGHFVEMAELGPAVAEAVRAEDALAQTNAMTMAEEFGSDGKYGESEEEGTTARKLQYDVSADETTAPTDRKSPNDSNTSATDYDGDDDDTLKYFEQVEILGDISSSSNDDGGEEDDIDTMSSSFAENERAHGANATHESEVASVRRAKRAKSKKAKKARSQARRDKKKVGTAQTES